jgi:hypothetical protein
MLCSIVFPTSVLLPAADVANVPCGPRRYRTQFTLPVIRNSDSSPHSAELFFIASQHTGSHPLRRCQKGPSQRTLRARKELGNLPDFEPVTVSHMGIGPGRAARGARQLWTTYRTGQVPMKLSWARAVDRFSPDEQPWQLGPRWNHEKRMQHGRAILALPSATRSGIGSPWGIRVGRRCLPRNR